MTPRYLASLGVVYTQLGHTELAIRLLSGAATFIGSEEAGGPSGWLGSLGTAYLMAGRIEEAEEVVQRALAMSQKRGERGYETWAYKRLGHVCAVRSGTASEDCRRLYSRAHARARELRMRPLAAHCDLALGKTYLAREDWGAATSHLTVATASYRVMGMRYCQAIADALLRRLPPESRVRRH